MNESLRAIRELTDKEIENAQKWYVEHTEFVETLLRFAGHQQGKTNLRVFISPGNEDAPMPNLWKYGHWAWFAEEGHLEGIE